MTDLTRTTEGIAPGVAATIGASTPTASQPGVEPPLIPLVPARAHGRRVVQSGTRVPLVVWPVVSMVLMLPVLAILVVTLVS